MEIINKSKSHATFIVVPRFNMATLVSLIEPMRVANYLSSAEIYSWEIASFEGSSVIASNGMPVSAGMPPEKMKRYDQAIENYKEVISINPNSSYALFRIGFCYEKKKDLNNSIAYYYKCINDDPNMDKAFYRISMYHYKQNNFKKATEFIEKAIKSNQEKSKYWKIYLNCLSKTSAKNY